MTNLRVLWEYDDGEAGARLLWSPELGFRLQVFGDLSEG